MWMPVDNVPFVRSGLTDNHRWVLQTLCFGPSLNCRSADSHGVTISDVLPCHSHSSSSTILPYLFQTTQLQTHTQRDFLLSHSCKFSSGRNCTIGLHCTLCSNVVCPSQKRGKSVYCSWPVMSHLLQRLIYVVGDWHWLTQLQSGDLALRYWQWRVLWHA